MADTCYTKAGSVAEAMGARRQIADSASAAVDCTALGKRPPTEAEFLAWAKAVKAMGGAACGFYATDPQALQKCALQVRNGQMPFTFNSTIQKFLDGRTGWLTVGSNEPNWFGKIVKFVTDNCQFAPDARVAAACTIAKMAAGGDGASAPPVPGGPSVSIDPNLGPVMMTATVAARPKPRPEGTITARTASGWWRIAVPTLPGGLSGLGAGLGIGPAQVAALYREEPMETAPPNGAKVVTETELERRTGKLSWYKDWHYLVPIAGGAATAIGIVTTVLLRRRARRS